MTFELYEDNPDTYLSAVNSVLSAIGQAPVDVVDADNPELMMILQIVKEANKDAQSEGWVFNQEQKLCWTPDEQGYIEIPNDVLRLDISDGQHIRTTDVIRRPGAKPIVELPDNKPKTKGPKTVLKFYQATCGPCGMMSRYDSIVVEEEGYQFRKINVDLFEFDDWKQPLYTIYPEGAGVGWPTYVLIDGDTPEADVIGFVRGAMDKGSFREKLKELTRVSCPHRPEGKGESGSAENYVDIYNDCNLTRSYVTDSNGPREVKDDDRRGKYRTWVNNDQGGLNLGNGEHMFALSDKETEEGGGGDGGDDCDNWNLVVNCPGPGDEGSPLKIEAKAEGVKDDDVTFKWYIGDDKQAEGGTYNGIYPACGTSVTFTMVARVSDCDGSHNKEKTCTVTSNACGGGDPCDGVTCPPGQICQNGTCVDDGSGGGGDPCNPNPCPDGFTCQVDGDTYQCIDPDPPVDPCEGVTCDSNQCLQCVNGICVSKCGSEQECDGAGNCVDKVKECPDTLPGYDESNCNTRPDINEVPGTSTQTAVFLYDKLSHTFVFHCPIYVDVTWLLPFNVLPPVFQRYITSRSSVRAAAQLITNPQLFQLLQQQEAASRAACIEYETSQGDYSFMGFPDGTMYQTYQPWQTLDRNY